MLCLRARGAVVRRKVASSVVLSLLPFPLWCAGFPFSLETHPIPFPLRRPPLPNLLPNFSWLIGNHIITTDYVYKSYSIFAMPHLVRRGLCPPRQLLYVPLLQNHCFCWHTSAHTCSNTQPCLKSRACRALPVGPCQVDLSGFGASARNTYSRVLTA